jgi:hypothetical protein
MTPRIPRHPGLLAGATGAAAGLALWAAFLVPPTAAAFAAPEAPARHAAARDTVPDARVRAALAQRHPELLRAPDRGVMVYFVADREGVVQKSLVVPVTAMRRAVTSDGSRPRPITVTPGGVAVDSTDHGKAPQAFVTRDRDVVAEIRAEVGPNRIQSVETWTSQAVPGGLLVGWVTLR